MGLVVVAIVIAILVFPFYVISRLQSLQRDVDRLEQQVKGLSVGRTGTTVPLASAVPEKPHAPSIYGEAYEVARATLERQQPPIRPQTSTGSPFTPILPPTPPAPTSSWLAEDTFMKIGAFFVLLAVGWFVSYAFMNNWIGPSGRIALGLGAGLLLMWLGVWRCLVSLSQGAVFTALGMSTALVTIFAARYAYDFFTPGTALVIMFLVVAATATISVRFKIEALAVIALLGGALAPILAHTANPDVLGLHVYLGILFAGALAVAAFLPAPAVVPVALGIAFVYSAPYFAASDLEETIARIAAYIYAASFLTFSTVALLRTQAANYATYLATTIGAGMYVAVWIIVTVAADLQGIVSFLWAVGFLFAASVLWQAVPNKVPAYVQAGMGLAFFALATAYYLDGNLLTIAYLTQITVMILVALRGLGDLALARRLAWLYGGVMLMSLPHFIASSWDVGVLHSDFLMLVAIGSVLFFVGMQLADAGDDTNTDAALITFGSLYGLSLVWLVTHTVFGDQLGTAVSLVLYTVIGLSLYLGGIKAKDEYARLFGGILVGGVIARLILVDVWELELIMRIIAFFVIGVLLLATAFFNKRKTEK